MKIYFSNFIKKETFVIFMTKKFKEQQFIDSTEEKKTVSRQ
jgi:hypothetical protein